MERFLRPKRIANEIPLGEDLAGVPQPSEARPDTQPCESEAGSSTADHAPSGNVTKPAKRSSTLTEDSNIEVMSCSSDTEVEEFEMQDQNETANYEETLEKIKLRNPEVVQWLRDDTHIDEAAQLRVTHLQNQARKIIMLASSLNIRTTQRSGNGESVWSVKNLLQALSPEEQQDT